MLSVVPGESDDHGDGAGARWCGLVVVDRRVVREGVRRMVAEALQAEVDAYIAAFGDERDENERRLVVRNGSHQPGEVLTSAGAVERPRRGSRHLGVHRGVRPSLVERPWPAAR